MGKLIPIVAITGGLLLFSGCKDHSSEIEDLEGRVAATEKKLNQQREELEEENATLREEIDRLNKGVSLPVDAEPVSTQLEKLHTRLGEVENADSSGDAAELEKRLSAKIDAMKAEAKKEAIEAAKLEAAKAGTGDMDKEAMAELVAKKMAEEAAANAPTKKLDQALARLDISQAEKDQIQQRILDSKQETLELLEVPTEDGRIFAEEVIDAFIRIQDKKGTQADIGKLFAELGSTKVPGDAEDRSYAEVLEDIKRRNKEDISRLLTEEDQNTLTRAHEDWSDFDVEGDPFGALYMERMQKYQEEKEAASDDE
ncbi:MAG: hypothetical protein ACYTDT_06585 [Planctomycetota bacterium]|jgi:hypothetical protein